MSCDDTEHCAQSRAPPVRGRLLIVDVNKAFGVNMDTLMRMQAACDIAKARKDAGKIRVRRYQPEAVHA